MQTLRRTPIREQKRGQCASVRDALTSDQKLSVWLIADHVGTGKMCMSAIIVEALQMRKICVKLVPKVLTHVQRQKRLLVCKDLSQRVQTLSFGIMR